MNYINRTRERANARSGPITGNSEGKSPMNDIQIIYDGPIVNKDDAKNGGLVKYFTGEPCRRGHIDQRYTVSGKCVSCKMKGAAKWRSKNPYYDKERYAATCEEQKANHKIYYIENSDRLKEYQRKYREENPDILRERKRDYYERNKEECIAKASKWMKDNPEKRRAITENRRSRELGAEGEYSGKDVEVMLSQQRFKCVYCDFDLRNGYHVDHIMPLALGGTNWPENLQCLCAECNIRKGSKHPDDWHRQIGWL